MEKDDNKLTHLFVKIFSAETNIFFRNIISILIFSIFYRRITSNKRITKSDKENFVHTRQDEGHRGMKRTRTKERCAGTWEQGGRGGPCPP